MLTCFRQTSVNTITTAAAAAAAAGLHTTMTTQAGVTSLLLLLGIFCSAAWARAHRRSTYSAVIIIFSIIMNEWVIIVLTRAQTDRQPV